MGLVHSSRGGAWTSGGRVDRPVLSGGPGGRGRDDIADQVTASGHNGRGSPAGARRAHPPRGRDRGAPGRGACWRSCSHALVRRRQGPAANGSSTSSTVAGGSTPRDRRRRPPRGLRLLGLRRPNPRGAQPRRRASPDSSRAPAASGALKIVREHREKHAGGAREPAPRETSGGRRPFAPVRPAPG